MSRPRKAPPVFTCAQCSETFSPKYNLSRGQYHTKQKFCTRSCAQKFLQAARWAAREIPTFACQKCGKETQRSVHFDSVANKRHVNYKQKFCSKSCAQLGRVHDRPSKGFTHPRTGYRYLLCKGKAIAEHRRIMEGMIGRPLKKHETVHHKNGDRSDNRPANLELWAKNHGPGQRVSDLFQFRANDYVLGALSLGG